MSEKHPVSFRAPDDINEYLDNLVDNKSEYVINLIKQDMRTRGLTRREKLEEELAELRDEKRKVSRRLDSIKEDEERLQTELENYRDNIDARVDDIIDSLGAITVVPPQLRDDKDTMANVIRKTGLDFNTLVDLCGTIDLHFSFVGEHNFEKLVRMGLEDYTDHELYQPDNEHMTLTDDEQEQVREYLRENL